MRAETNIGLPYGTARRWIVSDDAVAAAECLDFVRLRQPEGWLRLVDVVLGPSQGRVELEEARVEGFDLESTLPVVHRHISTGVALDLVSEAATALSNLHELKPTLVPPPIHGNIGLRSLLLCTEEKPGQLLLCGLSGERGRVQSDIRGLLAVLRQLLLPKAEKPGGAELLNRLSSLQFQSAFDLQATIRAHLSRQDPDKLERAKARFLRRVSRELRRMGPPSVVQEVPGVESDASSVPLVIEEPERDASDDRLPTQVHQVHDFHIPTDDLSLDDVLSSAPSPAPTQTEDSVPIDPTDARHGLMAPAAAPAERPTAVLVGDYRVVAAIGKGGMGEIYLARALSEDRMVALKVLGTTESGDDDALGMLMDEAAIMARIDHPHVLKVLDFGKAHGRIFLASEYLEGRPLVRVMIASYDRDGGLSHNDVAAIGAQAARGLHAAHTATTTAGAPLEVVHRDVSPQNIFVTYEGVTKVIDFGVARASERVVRTQIGLVKGKAAYMSPEQAEGRVLDARSDVFSLGICLWEMVAGKRLFKRPLDYDTLVAVQTAPIEPPSEVRGNQDPELDAIIMSALVRDPSRRTPTAEVLAERLEAYLETRGVMGTETAVSAMMGRLFGEEANRERALVRELEARAATEADARSLKELSGVSYQGGAKEITLVAEPDALGALDRYGEEQEITGERVIRKVKSLKAERQPEGSELITETPRKRGSGPLLAAAFVAVLVASGLVLLSLGVKLPFLPSLGAPSGVLQPPADATLADEDPEPSLDERGGEAATDLILESPVDEPLEALPDALVPAVSAGDIETAESSSEAWADPEQEP